ncbi:MAG: DMT family transporter [Bacteroidaceae bacterium]|nr:DMT family transporter [Bacteroidaceae bacterium]
MIVAVVWTFTALFSEVACKRMGALTLNVWRMVICVILLSITLWVGCGVPWPQYTNRETWGWLLASGFMGFVFGDYCLVNSYLLVGSRFGQLFMTLASPFAAIAAWVLLDERMSAMALLGMVVTITGISISILGKPVKGKSLLKLPTRGVVLAIGGALGQGVGLVLSKLGLQAYEENIPVGMDDVLALVPFAGTQIRAFMGLAGFGIAMLLTHQTTTLPRLWQDKETLTSAFLAILLGPFFGVALSLQAANSTHVGVAQTLMSLTPVLILWPAHLMFKTKITAREMVGAAIAVTGASLFWV